MNRLLASAITLVFCAALSAQNTVNPNKPYTSISSSEGYVTINELNFGIGLGETDVDFSGMFYGITTTHGYQVTKNFILGGGTGFSIYNGGTLFPLFLDIRYTFLFNKVTPYAFGDGGLLLNFSDFNGGTRLFINPGAGARYDISRTLAVNAGLGMQIQMGGGGGNRDTFLNFKVGLIYKPK
jgi:opacity protein-like surface antigen